MKYVIVTETKIIGPYGSRESAERRLASLGKTEAAIWPLFPDTKEFGKPAGNRINH